MQAFLCKVFAPLRRALPLVALLPLLFGAAVHAEGTPEGIVALSSEAGSGALLRAHSDALFVSHGGGGWEQVQLPAAPGDGRIAGVAAAGSGKGAWYIGGPGLGVLRTGDRGRTWEALNEGLPSLNVLAIASHADQPDTVYVYLADKGIFRSEDGGKRWKLMDGGPRERLTQFVHSGMPGSMQSGWLFAATKTGVARAMDCFCGWHDAGGLSAKVHAVAYDPTEPQRVYAATEKGLLVSANGGAEWTRLKSPGRRLVSALTVMPSGALYAASDHQLFRSTDGAKTWEQLDG